MFLHLKKACVHEMDLTHFPSRDAIRVYALPLVVPGNDRFGLAQTFRELSELTARYWSGPAAVPDGYHLKLSKLERRSRVQRVRSTRNMQLPSADATPLREADGS